MQKIEYKNLQDLNQVELLKILNKEKIREHLASHDEFNRASLEKWVAGKVEVDSTKGCKVKGIQVNGSVAGWCGIQFENEALKKIGDRPRFSFGSCQLLKLGLSPILGVRHTYAKNRIQKPSRLKSS